MKRFFFAGLFIFNCISYSQSDLSFNTELFHVFSENNLLKVENENGEIIYSKNFFNPFFNKSDLDGDGVDELLINDINDSSEYTLYIYNLLDTFYLASEINSGIFEPYQTTSEETDGLIIVTGNSDFSYMNKESDKKSLPINCWKYEDGELFSINEELYEIFIAENEIILEKLYKGNVKTCGDSESFKPFIISAFINYLNAGEAASADNLLETFYLCDDLNIFKEKLLNLFNEE